MSSFFIKLINSFINNNFSWQEEANEFKERVHKKSYQLLHYKVLIIIRRVNNKNTGMNSINASKEEVKYIKKIIKSQMPTRKTLKDCFVKIILYLIQRKNLV